MNKNHLLIIILIASAVLRLISLSSGDTLNDEVLIAFRGLGMIDFDEAQAQTTPFEWFDSFRNKAPEQYPNIPISYPTAEKIPWWAHLSFHDHPPLAFFVQNIFMKIFGENNFAFRLPSALLGIASIYLIYLIGTFLYSENPHTKQEPTLLQKNNSRYDMGASAGLISAALLGLTMNNIYISRVGMQEAYVIFFLLLASYLFLKSLQNDSYLPWLGIVLGLAFLAKYTSFVLVPIFLAYLFLFKRDYFLNKRFWIAILLSVLIFSPVIIYNVMLYRTVGHFDFQFSYIFGQNPEVWKVAPGKDISSLQDRISLFIPRLISTNSWLFLSLLGISFFAFFISLIENPKGALRKNNFLIICLAFLVLLILKIGPSFRFLTMLTPFFALSIAIFLNAIYSNVLKNVRMKKMFFTALLIIFGFEIFYSINNQILDYPKGPTPWLASKVRYENYNWGYNELNNFLEKELNGKIPALTFNPKYKFLEKLRDNALEKEVASELEPYPALIVYGGNFDKAAKLWTLDRLHIYHAWPIIGLNEYFNFMEENGPDYYSKSGFQIRYFIFLNNTVPSDAAKTLMQGGKILILNKRGENVFTVYKSLL